ncbi:hypothetical protein Tco_0595247, partial [Tanacetum coccineum]
YITEHWPCEPYDDERDPNDGGGTKFSSVDPVVETASADSNSTADPSTSTSDITTKKGTDTLGSIIAEGGADVNGAALNDDDFISEEDGQSVRRSSRKSVLPSKLKDFVVDGKVKYGINSIVKYFLGIELSHVMHAPKLAHMKSAFKVLRYIKSSHGNGDSLVSWKSKRQYVLAKSSAEAEFKAMSSVTCDCCCYSNSSVFHERTKHFEIDLFFLREKIAEGVIKTVKVKSKDNVSDLFTKGLPVADHKRGYKGLFLSSVESAFVEAI